MMKTHMVRINVLNIELKKVNRKLQAAVSGLSRAAAQHAVCCAGVAQMCTSFLKGHKVKRVKTCLLL